MWRLKFGMHNVFLCKFHFSKLFARMLNSRAIRLAKFSRIMVNLHLKVCFKGDWGPILKAAFSCQGCAQNTWFHRSVRKMATKNKTTSKQTKSPVNNALPLKLNFFSNIHLTQPQWSPLEIPSSNELNTCTGTMRDRNTPVICNHPPPQLGIANPC